MNEIRIIFNYLLIIIFCTILFFNELKFNIKGHILDKLLCNLFNSIIQFICFITSFYYLYKIIKILWN